MDNNRHSNPVGSSLVIRMGAAHWDARIMKGRSVEAASDFREMDRDQRRVWYRTFMDSVRAKFGKPEPRRRHRSKANHRRHRGTHRMGPARHAAA